MNIFFCYIIDMSIIEQISDFSWHTNQGKHNVWDPADTKRTTLADNLQALDVLLQKVKAGKILLQCYDNVGVKLTIKLNEPAGKVYSKAETKWIDSDYLRVMVNLHKEKIHAFACWKPA